MIAAILVTGGYNTVSENVLASVEVLSAVGTPLPCTLPPLPTSREDHTQDGLLSCGGYYTTTTCVKFSALAEGWVVTHKLLQPRAYHSSWMSPAGLVLMGGVNSPTTRELLSTFVSSSSYSFALEDWTRCV